MSPADREDYRAAFTLAAKRVPKRHTINHVVWRDGHMTVGHGPAPRDAEVVAPPSGHRGVQAELFG